MLPTFDELKRRFEAAKTEYIEAINAHKRAHAEAMLAESRDVNDAYREACADLDRKDKKYHELASQLIEAKRHKGA
ncbi:MAG: hypothetical protein AAB403_14550 [Planctomycetota bacterium]